MSWGLSEGDWWGLCYVFGFTFYAPICDSIIGHTIQIRRLAYWDFLSRVTRNRRSAPSRIWLAQYGYHPLISVSSQIKL